MTWQVRWEKLLIEKLDASGITYEKTSFKIPPDLRRRNDWDSEINSGQIVEIISPSKAGAMPRLKSINVHGLPVDVGTINFLKSEVDYKTGIICQLITKDHYTTQTTKTLLVPDQPIILTTAAELPPEILQSGTLQIKRKAEKSGCMQIVGVTIGVIVLMIILEIVGC